LDALSEILKTIRLTGATFVEAELAGPWTFETPPPRALADALMPDADHIVPYHLVTAGSCVARVPPDSGLELTEGDVVVFPHGDEHVLSGAGQGPARPLALQDLSRVLARGKVAPLRTGGTGPLTGLVCGFFAVDRHLAAPMLAGLPRVFRVSLSDDPGARWLHSSVRFSVAEAATPRAGAATVLAKLSELLFVEAIRRYVEQVPDDQKGWLAGLRDPHVAQALALLHGRPEHAWTVAGLAREVGQSRSVFAERFTYYLGQPPMKYLTMWRLALAADQLRHGRASIGRIAIQAGYDSEAAFTRAFKREFGTPPAIWRRAAAGAPSAR